MGTLFLFDCLSLVKLVNGDTLFCFGGDFVVIEGLALQKIAETLYFFRHNLIFQNLLNPNAAHLQTKSQFRQ